jgi:hypothetical protein
MIPALQSQLMTETIAHLRVGGKSALPREAFRDQYARAREEA